MMRISVIIPVYNAATFLQKAVESALQFEEVREILLIEDCSTDNSLEICHHLVQEDPRIQLFQHSDKGNHGAGASRNLGLEKSTQDFVAFLDADDYYLPNRFEAEKKLFKNEKIEGIFGAIGTEFLSEKGKKEFQQKFKNVELTTVKRPAEGKEIFRGLIGLDVTLGTFFHLNSLTIRKLSVINNNLKFNENLRVHQDSDFITKLSFHCFLKSGIIDKEIAIRGVHDENRITKIALYSDQYNERQSMLWKSIDNWAKTMKLQNDERKHISLKNKSFRISCANGLQKIGMILMAVLVNPNILKTRYRFTYLN